MTENNSNKLAVAVNHNIQRSDVPAEKAKYDQSMGYWLIIVRFQGMGCIDADVKSLDLDTPANHNQPE